jgi:hypothetical protein
VVILSSCFNEYLNTLALPCEAIIQREIESQRQTDIERAGSAPDSRNLSTYIFSSMLGAEKEIEIGCKRIGRGPVGNITFTQTRETG